jgi:two-component system, response regulator PdtaR
MSKVMIVEDEISIALELEELLDSSGYEVIGAVGTGTEAVSMAQAHCPDLILMDIKLPGKMDGIETAIIIRRELGIPSVFLTGYGKSEFVERAKAADSLGYILKPLNDAQILAALEIAVDKREREKAMRAARDNDARLIEKTAEELESAEKHLLEKTEALNELTHAIDVLGSINVTAKIRIENSDEAVLCSDSRTSETLPPELLRLSPQEFRIAQMIQKGKNSHQVAKALNISTDTVNWHRKHIRKKLGLSGQKTALIAKLASLGKI